MRQTYEMFSRKTGENLSRENIESNEDVNMAVDDAEVNEAGNGDDEDDVNMEVDDGDDEIAATVLDEEDSLMADANVITAQSPERSV